MEDIQPINIDQTIDGLSNPNPEKESMNEINNLSHQCEKPLGVDLANENSLSDSYEQLKQQNHISDISSDLGFLARDPESESAE